MFDAMLAHALWIIMVQVSGYAIRRVVRAVYSRSSTARRRRGRCYALMCVTGAPAIVGWAVRDALRNAG